MAITKTDLAAIRGVVKEEVGTLRGDMQQGFAEMKAEFTYQRQAMDRGFEEMKSIMEQTYATKEEVDELRTELDDLREEMKGFRGMFAQK